MSNTEDDRKPDVHDGALVAWERRQYREYKPVWIKIADDYKFKRKAYRVLAYTSAYLSTLITGLYFAKDHIWHFTKAVWQAILTMPQ